ncbi:TIGR02206 family membrane protein [Brevibacillus fluminis]|uniref:YwaF family protein n=1 Tax=Brevibacillus fluminis TaxID=511487 RepID=UPI001FE39C73|nr:TIGR02206 family membrane protein [Brevibacillus fluminis]
MNSPFLQAIIEGQPFQLFSLSHICVLLLLLLAIALLYIFRNDLRLGRSNLVCRYGLVVLLLMTEIAYQLWHLGVGTWTVTEVLPLQLCSVSLLLSCVMLVSRSYRLFEVTYFWGIGGAGQAMLTPELFYPFPHFRFFHFFLAHGAIILACLHMVWVEGYRPTFRSIGKALLWLNALLLVALLVNQGTGGNYLFAAHKPENPSLIDYLGPYPWYLLSLEGVAFLLFYVLFLPFRGKQKAMAPSSELT